MPIITSTRDAVVTAINGAGLTPAVTAVAAYEAVEDLKDLAGGSARIVVIPRAQSPELLTYAHDEQRQTTIDVIIQYHALTLKTAELDPYLTLAESIEALMIGYAINAGSSCVEVQWPEGTWSLEFLQNFKVLSIPLSLVFETVA